MIKGDPMLEIKNLSKSFERDAETIYPVYNLDFSLQAGELACIMGRSGSGKTTLLNLLALFLKPDSGEINYQGQSVLDFDDQAASLYRNQDLAYVTQQATAIPSLNVLENILLPATIHQVPDEKQMEDLVAKAEDLMQALGIQELKNQPIRRLSGGEKKRVILARALINEPKILLLDEPTSDLDETSSLELIALLQTLNENGASMIVVTHDPLFKQLSHALFYTLRQGQLEEESQFFNPK